MEAAGNIEVLTVFFTLGAAAGTLLRGGVPQGALQLLLPILMTGSAAPFFFRGALSRSRLALPVLGISFFLLGIFTSLSGTFDGLPHENFLTRLSEDAVTILRSHIRRQAFPSEETAPLLLALLTGDRSGLSRESITLFRESGASHLLALSGLHIGIIYLILDRLSRLLGRFPLSRAIRWGGIVFLSGFFTIMTGAAPSIVRAFLFILINESLTLGGRSRKASQVLSLALLIQLVLTPEVIRSVGFQLSYLAMTGIIFLYPVLEKWYPEGLSHDPLRALWKSAALSLSCQLLTAPLVWYRFHSFPPYFLLTNLLALPLTGLLMGCAILSLGWSALFPCPELLLRATDALASLLIQSLEIISSM